MKFKFTVEIDADFPDGENRLSKIISKMLMKHIETIDNSVGRFPDESILAGDLAEMTYERDNVVYRYEFRVK